MTRGRRKLTLHRDGASAGWRICAVRDVPGRSSGETTVSQGTDRDEWGFVGLPFFPSLVRPCQAFSAGRTSGPACNNVEAAEDGHDGLRSSTYLVSGRALPPLRDAMPGFDVPEKAGPSRQSVLRPSRNVVLRPVIYCQPRRHRN